MFIFVLYRQEVTFIFTVYKWEVTCSYLMVLLLLLSFYF